jgi:hypothetical protein
MSKRKTAVDYRKEYKETVKTMKSITAHVRKRVVEMSELYPDTIVMGDVRAIELTKRWVSDISVEVLLFVLDRLEAASAAQQKVTQKEIEM